MKSILEEIYYGFTEMSDFKLSEEYWKILDKVDEKYGNLEKTLDETQKKMLYDLNLECSGLEAETAHDYFIYGFKLGMKIMFEAFLKQ